MRFNISEQTQQKEVILHGFVAGRKTCQEYFLEDRIASCTNDSSQTNIKREISCIQLNH